MEGAGMRTIAWHAASLLAFAALSACGGRQTLQRTPEMGAMPVARGASAAPTPDELMQPGTQARPDRSSEPLSRSERRADDPFDLPPAP